MLLEQARPRGCGSAPHPPTYLQHPSHFYVVRFEEEIKESLDKGSCQGNVRIRVCVWWMSVCMCVTQFWRDAERARAYLFFYLFGCCPYTSRMNRLSGWSVYCRRWLLVLYGCARSCRKWLRGHAFVCLPIREARSEQQETLVNRWGFLKFDSWWYPIIWSNVLSRFFRTSWNCSIIPNYLF